MGFRRTDASDVSCFVLAGGVGERLAPLTRTTPKPLLPFGGVHRLLDFTLSNAANSGLAHAFVLSQYMTQDIGEYLATHWRSPLETRFVHQPPDRARPYRGTADAIGVNLASAEDSATVLVLSADHVYRMDYRRMLDAHIRSGAGATLAVTPVPVEKAFQFGIVSTDSAGRVVDFVEKPEEPDSTGADTLLANMGVYLFERSVLEEALSELEASSCGLDFGRDVLPYLVEAGEVAVFRVQEEPEESFYWRDVGTLASYYEANMDLLAAVIPFELDDPAWPIRDSAAPWSECRTLARDSVPWINSLVASPITSSDALIERSIVSPGVVIDNGADVLGSIVLPGAHIGEGAAVRNAIVDAYAEIPDGDEVGYDAADDRERFEVTGSGLVIVSPTDCRRQTGRRDRRWAGDVFASSAISA